MIVQISDSMWINDRWIVSAYAIGDAIAITLDHGDGSPFKHDADPPWVTGAYADRLRQQWGRVSDDQA